MIRVVTFLIQLLTFIFSELIVVDSKRRQASERCRHLVIHTATLWGYHDPAIPYKYRCNIAKAACRQVAYDHGYAHTLAHTQLPNWHARMIHSISGGESSDPLSPSHCGSKSYIKTIEEHHPGYIRFLFRYAQEVRGPLESYQQLANTMNMKSSVPGEERPVVLLSRRQVSDWFANQGGKEVSSIKKPLLTSEHKEQRKRWAQKYWNELTDPNIAVCFADEKWFYTTNRRKTLKVLPLTEEEKGRNSNKVPRYSRPKIRSRRYPVKVMYFGIVAAPVEDRNFDGRVYLKRVSRRKKLTRATRNSRFSVNVLINQAMVEGTVWRTIIEEENYNISTAEVANTLVEMYDLDEFVGDRLVFSYYTYINNKKTVKNLADTQTFNELGVRTTEEGTQVPLTVDDVSVQVMMRRGDEVDEDITCDSNFMLDTIPDVAQTIRDTFHWVPDYERIYLVMDNAGGHGTDQAKDAYVSILRQRKIEVIWQVPRSPETNMLDLGVWMSIQATVQRVHFMRRCHHDALAASVEDAWNSHLNSGAFLRVYRRIRVVLRCILDDNGGNHLVEAKRGKLFRDATIIDLTDENEDDEAETSAVVNLLGDLSDFEDDCSIGSI